MAAEPTARVIALGEILHQYQLSLVLIAGTDEHTLARPVQWVHVSEIEDPTPFLTANTVLLTTGARFSALRRQSDADAYVARLVEAGVAALGVGVGLHWDRVPPRIVSACDRLGLPLFRVPYDTPFIAIVQSSVRLLEARDRERDLWLLESQRAVSNAALRPEGLPATLHETAQRLHRWVCVTDRSGRIIDFAPENRRADSPVAALRAEAHRMVERGVSSGRIGTSANAENAATGMQLQTLGRPVRGVLIVEEAGVVDAAERQLIGLTAAIATMQLEHRAGADSAQAALREAVVELLLGGDARLAAALAQRTGATLPSGEVTVLRHPPHEQLPYELADELQLLGARGDRAFSAVRDGSPIIIAQSRATSALRKLFLAHHCPAGLSRRGPVDTLAELLEQADRALEHAVASGGDAPVDYAPELHPGVMHLLHEHPEAQRRAEGLLAPLFRNDAQHRDHLVSSLRVWLAHHGQTSPAATELGVHRHTLTARLRSVASLLQRDLDSPDARAELWAALRLTDGSPNERSDSNA